MDAKTAVHNRRRGRGRNEKRLSSRSRACTMRRLQHFLYVGVVGLGAAGVTACSSDVAGPNPPSRTNVFWSLAYQTPAVNLAVTAPYNTVQLVAVPRTATGAVVSDTGTVQYSTIDSAINVSATGLVTARFPSARALVVARLTVGGITLADTAIVAVTETPPPAALDTLTIQIRPGVGTANQLRRALLKPYMFVDSHSAQILPFYAVLADGELICKIGGCPEYPLLVHFASSDPTIAKIDQTGRVSPFRAGHVLLSVSTLAYGVLKTDTLSFAVGYPGNWTTEIHVDSTQHPFVPYIQNFYVGGSPPNILSVNGKTSVTNYGQGEQLEIETPGLAHGVHFVDKPNDQVKDTLDYLGFVPIQFDSVGTYTVTYRLLSTGKSVSASYTIEALP